MAVQLNHTIVHVGDRELSARFMTEILGLPAPRPFGHFLVVEVANGVVEVHRRPHPSKSSSGSSQRT